MAKETVSTLREKKQKGEKIVMLTAYDYPSAVLADEAGIEMILVGDSLGMAVLGYETTLPVTMDDMVYHTRMVSRGAKDSMVVSDLPFLSYHLSIEQGVANAGRLIQEAGAHAVKLEGGEERIAVIQAIVAAGIPVVGHLGLTPQSVHQMGGYKVQGKEKEQAAKLLQEARLLEEAGICALVLECVPAALAKVISSSLTIPTIGIGAGPDCDGQVLVWHDLLGITRNMKPRFVKRYADLHSEIMKALHGYRADVKEGSFPQAEHSFGMAEENIPQLY